MQQALSQCASLVGGEKYFVFCFSLLQFIDNFLVYSETIRNVTKVMEIFKKCGGKPTSKLSKRIEKILMNVKERKPLSV